MENCVIYSHQLAFDKVIQLVKSNLPKAEVHVNEDGLNKFLVATIKGGLFGKDRILKLNYRQRLNPSYTLTAIECPLTQNLAGMVNYVKSWQTNHHDVKGQLIYKAMSVNTEMAFMAEPDINISLRALLQAIAHELDAIIFSSPNKTFDKSTSQYFADKDFNLILDATGNSEIKHLQVNVDAKYHDAPESEITPEQKERKGRSEALLSAKGVKVNANLPCIPSEGQVKLRSLNEVIERAYALLVLAAKGEGVEQAFLDRAIAEKNITGFSPYETKIISAVALDDNERAYATWRYESLAVMLWALGKTKELPYPSVICNVPEVVSLIFKPSRDEFVNGVTLRSSTEILDQLDQIYRMHWACVDARIKNEPLTGSLESGVVYERHYALNWLTTYLDQDWDDVQTNT